MKFTQVRNATVIIEYNHTRFLVDPVLADKGAYPSFANAPRQEEGNPSVDLPFAKEVLLDVDAVVVTHLHSDHFDDVAKELIPKEMKVFVQNDGDLQVLKNIGFKNLEVLAENTTYHDITLIRTPGQHGRGDILKRLGTVSGVVFQHPTEKTLYLTGDTIWYEGTEKIMRDYQPNIVVANAGANQFYDSEPIVMGKEDLYELHKFSPAATIIASHMEAMNHWGLSRVELRQFTKDKGFAQNVLVPEDGDSYVL